MQSKQVKTSWSEERGDKDYLRMTIKWFKEYMFEVVMDRSLLFQEALTVFQKKLQIPIWFSVGTLA